MVSEDIVFKIGVHVREVIICGFKWSEDRLFPPGNITRLYLLAAATEDTQGDCKSR